MSDGQISRLSRGRAAFVERKYDIVIDELHDFSLADNAHALELLSEAMLRSKGKRDRERILRIQIMAANLGSRLACLRVAGEYSLSQEGVRKAEEYFLKAAQLGSNLAYRCLGEETYTTGDTYSQAQRFKSAAEHGNAKAMFEYGRMIELGIAEPNYVRYPSNPIKGWIQKDWARRKDARDWYIDAALAGCREVVGHMMEMPVLIPGKQVMRDIQSWRSSIEDAAKSDNVLALSVKGFALMYSGKLSGSVYSEANLREGFSFLLRAAHKGNYYAMGEVGRLYYKGWTVEKSCERALAWSIYAMQCEAKYAPPIEELDLLLVDVEEQIPLELCAAIKRDPLPFCK